ncbi:hypothetical protein, unlikely [Trypanosoma congolense IL3000]|uniref:Uncharacterized protein n=1 Tax=Trypanosoma congolense (strain IL3000) TaxID=1068625 RepID=F9W690_TRYCI|nr:hypothetical protein, unlikely [Trypanosoma congolense IL3000]
MAHSTKNALPRHCQRPGSPRWCAAVIQKKVAPDSDKDSYYTLLACHMKRDHPGHRESLRPESCLKVKTYKASQGTVGESDRWRVCRKDDRKAVTDDGPVKCKGLQGNENCVNRDFVCG